MNYYAEFKIIGRLNSMIKKISDSNLKVGDRFIYPNHEFLMYKTNAKARNGKILCCDESGRIEWIDEKVKVTKINGVRFELQSFSKQFIKEFYRQEKSSHV